MPHLSENDKNNLIFDCLELYDRQRHRFPKGALLQILAKYNISVKRIQSIFLFYQNFRRHNPFAAKISLKPKMKGRVGRKSKYTDEIGDEIIHANRITRGRLTIRALSEEINVDEEIFAGGKIPSATLCRYINSLSAEYHHSHIKPTMPEKNAIDRLLFVLLKIRVVEGQLVFEEEKNTLHLDEKWWYLEIVRKTVRTFPGEDEFDFDTVAHKDHRTKFMGTAVIGYPEGDFDGRVAWINHVTATPALRNSVNRPAGTIEYIPYNVNAENFYESFVSNGGIIQQVSNRYPNRDMIIQIDNARPHTGEDNVNRINQYARSIHASVTIKCQPANSPDLNMCDQSFFHSLSKESDKLTVGCRTVGHLIEAVKRAWEEYDATKLIVQYGHMYAVWNEVLKHEGSNQFKNPHSNVRNKIAAGIPLNNVEISRAELERLKAKVNTFYGRIVI
jgi:hypothetical protein